MGGTGRHRSSVLSKSRKPPRSRHCSTGVKLAGTDLKREGLRLQPVDPLWLLVRQTWLEQDQGSGDRGLATASGTGDRLWTLGVSGPCRRDSGWRPLFEPALSRQMPGWRRPHTPPSTFLPFVACPALTLRTHPGSCHLAGVLPAVILLTQARGSAPCVRGLGPHSAGMGRNKVGGLLPAEDGEK